MGTGEHAAGPPPPPEDLAARLRARKVDAIGRLGLPLMVANTVNAWAFALVLTLDRQISPPVLAWAATVTALAAWSALHMWRRRARPAPETASINAVRRATRSAALFGLVWAVPGVAFLPGVTGFSMAFGTALITGMISGGAFALYPIPPAAMAFLLPAIVSTIAGMAATFGPPVVGLAIIAAMFIFIFHSVIRRHADLFDAEFRGRLELERQNRLIEELLEDARLEVLGSRKLGEERMAQAKKMEAIGQLTSGIAHDFNNLLTAVRGNAELLSLDRRYDPALVEAIIQVSERGARQVQRLLSIAERQRLQPECVDLAQLLTDLRRLLEATLGPEYPIRVAQTPGVPDALADPGHLENALINLVFNARDSMPEGGEILISCAVAPARGAKTNGAQMVDISVRDFGVGMDPETQERALDPFFTTKEFGQGSGLGLSSVAGFARQSGGDVRIDSQPGLGTTVTIRLPAEPAAREAGVPAASSPDAPLPATVRVLVVEDQQEVLAVTRQMLTGLNYRVVTASRAEEALTILNNDREIDLVLTDILLSGSMTGLNLAREIATLAPGTPVTFMSAWSPKDIDESGHLKGTLLKKPFSRDQLARHVEEALADATLRNSA